MRQRQEAEVLLLHRRQAVKASEYAKLILSAGRAKGRKYRNKPVVHDGTRFDSRAELRRWNYLSVLAKAGKITDLRRQVKYLLFAFNAEQNAGVPIKGEGGGMRFYVADFVYTDEWGKLRIEDVKGMDTPLSKLKRDIVRACYGVEVEIIR
jgi:Protein of unknown function (DUF1064)